ncbi:hypothetical protein ACW7BJ_33380 [Azospirillum argentinense]
MKNPILADGVMTIFLGEDERPVDLKANARAAKAISRHFGGIADAYGKVSAMDFAAVEAIFNAATGRVGKDAEATADEVFDAGMAFVAPLLSQYLGFLASGGKAPKAAKEADAETEPAEGNAEAA